MGPIPKKSLDMGPISQKLQTNWKIGRFEAEKSLEMGLDLRKFRKKEREKKNLSNQPYFEWEKSLDMGKGFGPRAAHSVKK